jgi:RNA-binding protein 26
MRGDLCPYDHGTDRIIVDESAGAFAGAPFASNGPMAPMGGRGPQPFFGMPGVPDAYDPERAGLMPPTEMTGFLPGSGMLPNDMMGMNNNMMRGSNGMHRGGRGGGRGMGRGRGGYHNRPYHNQNQNPLNTTLNVEKIPAEFCQISTVNDFFAKFGTITNISVLPHMQKAVIQYSTRAEAENAYNSPDAIFDNRFVKVYWAKEEPAANAASPAAATDGSQLAAAPKVNEPDPELVKARAAELAKEKEEKLRKHKEHLKRVLEIQKKKETLLQQQIDEQKRLLAKLSDTANMSKAEKSELLNALKRIQSDIDTSKSTAAAAAAVDAEAPTSALEGGVKETVETAEDLKKKLARLEAEVIYIYKNSVSIDLIHIF